MVDNIDYVPVPDQATLDELHVVSSDRRKEQRFRNNILAHRTQIRDRGYGDGSVLTFDFLNEGR